MFGSLITWGIPLNVMIGLIFYFILQKPLIREIVPLYSAHEILAFAVTGIYDEFFFFRFQFKVEHFKLFEIFELFFLFSAHFVLFYFVLIMSYRSIKLYGRRTERDFDWKIVSIAIGFLELALSIGITTFFIYLSICFEAPIVLLVTCLIFGEMEFFFIDFLKKGWTLSSNKTTEILTFFTFLQFLI